MVESLRSLQHSAELATHTAAAERVWQETEQNLSNRPGKNYSGVLWGVKIYEKVFEGRERKNLFRYSYGFFRNLDDMADGDIEPPAGFTSSSYIEDILKFIRDPSSDPAPTDSFKLSYLAMTELAGKDGLTIQHESVQLLESLLFDAKRAEAFKQSGKLQTKTKEELEDYFFKRDIEGTVRLQLKIYGDDPEHAIWLRAAADAIRITYDIRDFSDDISKGLVNIPREDLEEIGLTEAELMDFAHGNFSSEALSKLYAWFLKEAKRGLAPLAEFDQFYNNHKSEMKLASRLHKKQFEGPTRKFLEKVVENNGVVNLAKKASSAKT